MHNDDLIEILQSWSFWDGKLPKYIKREIVLPDTLSNKIILNIQGVRRCGKSTLLLQILRHFKLNPKRCAFVNFEDPRLTQNLSFEILEKILINFSKLHLGEDIYFFFDEIQNVKGWEKWIRSKIERPSKAHFIITGSNASLLSGEYATVLSGRHITIELFPFSYKEYRRVKSTAKLSEFLRVGGFPEPALRGGDDKLLKQYFDDILERDIKGRLEVRSALSLRQVIQMAYETSGSEISLRKIAGATGIAVDTVSSYIESAQAAFLLLPCCYFAYSERKRANKNKKYYAIDCALRRAVSTKSGQDLGKMLEISIFIELRKQFSEVYYWKNRGEVDFVINTAKGLTPIQVTWDQLQARHKNALEEFYEQYPNANEAIVIDSKNYLQQMEYISDLKA